MKERIKQRIGEIGFVCLVAFVAGLIGYGFGVSQQHECKTTDQYDVTAFDTPPTEAIYPEGGAVSFNWDGMRYVVAESTWEAKTASS